MANTYKFPPGGDKDVLSVEKSTRYTRVQTPELTRHASSDSVTPESLNPREISVDATNRTPMVVLKVEYRNLGAAVNGETTLSTPDVIIECVEDTVPLKEVRIGKSENVGMQNLAFDSIGQFSSSRSSNLSSQETLLSANRSNMYLCARPTPFMKDLECSYKPFAFDSGKTRLYYSLPKSAQKKCSAELRTHSQPSSPRTDRSMQTNLGSTPCMSPMTPFPPENGVEVYTISGRGTVVSSTMPDDIFSQAEKYFFQDTTNETFSVKPKSTGSFEFTDMPESVDLKRRRLQFYTDFLSIFLLIVGMVLVLATPALLIPLFTAPRKMYIPLISIFLAGGTLSTLILGFSGVIGNIVWNYDEENKKLKWRLHCGKGPIFHYWANGFHNLRQGTKNRNMIV